MFVCLVDYFYALYFTESLTVQRISIPIYIHETSKSHRKIMPSGRLQSTKRMENEHNPCRET